MDIVIDGQHKHMVPVQTQVLVADITHLLEDDHGGDDQEKGDDELRHDEGTAKTALSARDADTRSQDVDQSGIGKHERRISAREEADEQPYDQDGEQGPELQNV